MRIGLNMFKYMVMARVLNIGGDVIGSGALFFISDIEMHVCSTTEQLQFASWVNICYVKMPKTDKNTIYRTWSKDGGIYES